MKAFYFQGRLSALTRKWAYLNSILLPRGVTTPLGWPPKLFLLLVILASSPMLKAQNPFYSESIIKYDINTHKTDKPIPFDRAFTLVVEKVPVSDVSRIELFEATFYKGERDLVHNILDSARKCGCVVYKPNKRKHEAIYNSMPRRMAAIMDDTLKFKLAGDTLQIYVPALKPNKEFDFNIVSRLPKARFARLLQVSALWAEGLDDKAKEEFEKLQIEEIDPLTRRNYFVAKYDSLKVFYDTGLDSFYRRYSLRTAFTIPDSLRLPQVQAVVTALAIQKVEYKDAHYLVEATKDSLADDIMLGLIDLKNVYNKATATNMHHLHTRAQNLGASLPFFDSLHQKVTQLIANGVSNVIVGRDTVLLDSVRRKLALMRTALTSNHKILTTAVSQISNLLHAQRGVLHGFYLASNTVASDLKTAGGSVLFLDAGLTNMMVPGLTGGIAHIPRLYWGVSVYFRPIDKNTRRNRFPKQFADSINCGRVGARQNGPDYGALSRWSVWQHLSLNLGFTLGNIGNKDFENLYNNTSLLIGPAYRFARSFKISAGTALLKASQKNPLISEKKIIAGGYISYLPI